jgi:S-adenosylmethionine synthetase
LTGRKKNHRGYLWWKGAHGGGAFSEKDPSKSRPFPAVCQYHIVKILLLCVADLYSLVQALYAIGVAKPMGIFVDTYIPQK